MKNLFLILLLIVSKVNLGENHNYLNEIWNGTLYRDDNSIDFQTTIPTGTYTSIVKDILWGFNDIEYRYIGNHTVQFSNNFPSDFALLNVERVLLIFHGIDTFGIIKFNHNEIGKTSNMFVRYVFDIKEFLKVDGTNNLLEIEIESAIKKAKEIYDAQSENYIVYPKCVPSTYHGECHVNHIRKMQASFAWDWGPAVPSSGIWRPIEIVPIADLYMVDHTLDVYLVNNMNWKVNVTVLLEIVSNNLQHPIDGTLQITLENTEPHIEKVEISVNNGDKQRHVSITLDIPDHAVLRWWPNGFGQQHLYNLTIKIDTNNTHITRTKRIGFRTVELIQEPLSKGLSFYFRINGIPIFAKGSNVIPISITPETSTNYMYLKNLLISAKEVHMNMLRVWGGGVYESEMFYDLADELGIMIWQDFMFACSMYPTTKDFLTSVRTEVVQNVWRLKSHTAIVIWAGNNENEAALLYDWYGTDKAQIYRDDYIKLYVDVIKSEVEKLDLTRPFVVSSPSNGLWTDENGWIGTDPYSNLYGDIHYYNYITDGWNINIYPRPRFSSEYGFQSLPSIYTLESAAKNSTVDLNRNSEFINSRQHLTNGNFYLETLIKKNFRMPSSNNSRQEFDSYIYLSQINQAQSVKVETESYRQARSSINDVGEGFTMGALYWQLNDVWQAPTWSSIDIDGRWKVLHNYAKDFFAPIIISPRLSPANDLTIFIISDQLTSRFNCSVEVNIHKIYKDNNRSVVSHLYEDVSILKNSAYELTTIRFEDYLTIPICGSTFNEAKNNCIIELILKDSTGQDIAPTNYVYPTALKNLDLPTGCHVLVSVENADNGYRITIQSPCTLMFIRLELPGYMIGKFSENGFHVLNGKKSIYFDNSPNKIDIQTFSRELTIMSLVDTYSSSEKSNIIVCIDCNN